MVQNVDPASTETGAPSAPLHTPNLPSTADLDKAAAAIREWNKVEHWRDRVANLEGFYSSDVKVQWAWGKQLGGYDELTAEVAAIVAHGIRRAILEALENIESRAHKAVLDLLNSLPSTTDAGNGDGGEG